MDLFSTTQEDTNSQGWTLLMNTIEYTGSLSIVDYYLEGDVTATEEYTELCEKHLENFLEKGDADKQLLTKRIVKLFMRFQTFIIYPDLRYLITIVIV